MGTPDSREYDRLKDRGFRPYSVGHRRMYEKAIASMSGPQDIFEAGFGIGWGLDQMVAAGVAGKYYGVEPNRDSYAYVAERYALDVSANGLPRLFLHNTPFDDAVLDELSNDGVEYDHAFCIEVIEHVPADGHLAFIKRLHAVAPTLWLSTPCIRRNAKEGVRPTEEWEAMLYAGGFSRVTVDRSEWTYLYKCER